MRDGVNELTVRALVVGGLLGALLAASNVYVGLKIAFYDAGAITAAILGYAVLAALGREPSAKETNVLVTTSAAAAVMSGASGLIGPVAAMVMLGHGYSAWAVIVWSLALAVFGVLIALPLRAPLVTSETGLPFPTGRATAEVIASMEAVRTTGARRARMLFAGAGISAVVAWFRDGRPSVIPPAIPIPGTIGGHSLESLTVSVSVSPLLLSAGALIGLRNGICILVGAVVAWVVLAPILIDGGVVPSGDFADVVSWLIWPGAALMIASTLTSLVLQWRSLAGGVAELRSIVGGGRSSIVVGLAVTAAVVFAIGWLAFDVHPVAAVVGIALAPVLAAACARSGGETDIPPVGPLGGVAQMVIGPMTPGDPIATLGGGAIVNGAAAHTSQLMYAFRAGQLLGSSPRALVAAQLIGCAVGALVVVPVYELLTRAYGLGSEMLPAGAPLSWKATAEAVSGGIAGLPVGAPLAAAIAGGLGIAITVLERTRARRFLPAPVALGTAFLIPASYSIALFLGAVIFAAVRHEWTGPVDEHGTSVAAGGIAGEAVMGIVIALFTVLGVFGTGR